VPAQHCQDNHNYRDEEKEVCVKMNMHGMSARETAASMNNLTSYKVLILNRKALSKLKDKAVSMGIGSVL